MLSVLIAHINLDEYPKTSCEAYICTKEVSVQIYSKCAVPCEYYV
jgi:hypothetical protein